jgi:threonine/homoserine/homoserine lactone efflux protein
MDILAFILVSIGVIIIPGPNVLVIISTSITDGRRRGLETVAGTSCAMIIQLVIAALGTAWFVQNLVHGFLLLKWIGVGYLVYLGISHLLRAARNTRTTEKTSTLGTFQRGFWVSLTNPKTILFFSAFLPQFVSVSAPYMVQISLLSAIFWILAVLLDGSYAVLAGRLARTVKSESLWRWRDIFSGTLFLGAGAILAVTRISARQ